MKLHHQDYEIIPFPKLWRALVITYPSAQRQPMIHGLLEVDVTRAREYLREHKANTGESLSFTAFIITCVAHAVDRNKALHACRRDRKQLVLFEQVDVATLIEREMAGQKQPIIHIIRAANQKPFRTIHQEIRDAQVGDVEHAWESYRDFRFLPVFCPLLLSRQAAVLFGFARSQHNLRSYSQPSEQSLSPSQA